MTTARYIQTATLLQNGMVLITGAAIVAASCPAQSFTTLNWNFHCYGQHDHGAGLAHGDAPE